MTTPQTDAELVQATLAGDRRAVERLVERYRRTVVAVACAALGNADDAQDVAQEALVYALQHLPDLREPDRLLPWLRRIALSRCADYRRRRGTRPLGLPLTQRDLASEENDLLLRLAVRQAVAHLPEIHRTTLLLRYVGGWSLREVAEYLGVPVNTVRSRLAAAKRALRVDLHPLTKEPAPMPSSTADLAPTHASVLSAAFPGATVLSVQENVETWLPFSPRVRLTLADGGQRTIDFRRDIGPQQAGLLPVLSRLGVPGPRLVYGPVDDGTGGYLTACEVPRGENLNRWALGGTPHRIRLATERAFEAVERLQSATDALLADPVGASLPRRTLSDEVARIAAGQTARFPGDAAPVGGDWQSDPWFAAALGRVQAVVADIRDPLAFTHYLHFQPNYLRIQPGTDPFSAPWGWPEDARYHANPLAEIVYPFGYLGDALLGLAMIWIYDAYPFVHAGFVEQFLWRRNITRRQFAARLAVKALFHVQRELPVARPAEGGEYWDALHGYVGQALAWM
ncbi:MAG: RNA polymerase sigma factor [Candidatus Latescibacterota bacterium]